MFSLSPRGKRGQGRTAREKDTFGIDRERVDDSIVARKVEHKRALGTFPFLDIVPAGRAGCKRVLGWVDRERAYGFFVVGERDHGLSSGQVP